MEVSEQIIQVLDAVCERFGIVVDWSQKNVLPYAQDLMRRIVLFEALTSLMWIVVCVVVVFFAIKLIKKVIKLHKEGDCLIEFEELDRCACLVAGIVSAILCSSFGSL